MGIITSAMAEGLAIPSNLTDVGDILSCISLMKYITRIETDEIASQILFFESGIYERNGYQLAIHPRGDLIRLNCDEMKKITQDELLRVSRLAFKNQAKVYVSTTYLGKEKIPTKNISEKSHGTYSSLTNKNFTAGDIPELTQLAMLLYRLALVDRAPCDILSAEPIALAYHLQQKGMGGKKNPPHVHLLFSM